MSLNKDCFHLVQSDTLERKKKGQGSKHSISTLLKIKPNAKMTKALLLNFFLQYQCFTLKLEESNEIFNFYDCCHNFTNKYTNCFTQSPLCAIGSIRWTARPVAQLQFFLVIPQVLCCSECSTAQVGNGGYHTDPGFPCKTSKRCHLQHYLS